jgi:hypothetical protein
MSVFPLRWLLAALAPFAALCAVPAAAKDVPEYRQFRAGEPIVIAPDKAYVLVRLDTDLSKFGAHILRVPAQAEIDAYEVAKRAAFDKAGKKAGAYESFVFDYDKAYNYFALAPGKSLAMSGKMALVLAEIPPGDYVLYGMGFGNYLYECFCYGTVGFHAKAGEVTDLGSTLFAKAWQPSPVPELAGEVDLGRTAVMDYGLFAAALRPRRADDAAAPGVDAARVVPAALHAVGAFVETNTLLVNRLAAIPGVLAYREGHVIDVASGRDVTEETVN